MKRQHVHIKGVVQGVGFRPFVHSLATEHGLSGWVINDSRGVEIEVDGSVAKLDSFMEVIRKNPPPLAQIIDIVEERSEIPNSEAFSGFEIRASVPVEGERVLISPDIATCGDCLGEMYDPADRRYRYPFLNCTNCGPRFTIIEDLPYDRPKTTMSEFPMCSKCGKEFKDPSDRRFHAQPTCCPECGPSLSFLDHDGVPVKGDPVELTIDALRAGKTVAIKGLGGFHLACDATNPDAVLRLRERKHREAKPLAVMAGGISAAKRIAEVNIEAEKALLSPARPILILPRRKKCTLADEGIRGVTGGIGTIGIMLPYTPLHHLLFRTLPVTPPSDISSINPPEEIGGPPDAGADAFEALVMTSGNLSDEPIAADNDEAIERLHGIADAFLVHNRKIHRRADDSVATLRNGEVTIWRWGRGHVPRPFFLPDSLPPVLGVGGELKTTICHVRDDKAFVSPHIGDLKTFETYEYLKETIGHQERILDVTPGLIACDMHPDYHSTRYARERSDEDGIPVVEIQHHHAHVAALLTEHGFLDTEILALVMDGTGYGTDGAIWGGEIFRVDITSYTRLGQFNYTPLPGGDVATKEVWRSALGRLCLPAEKNNPVSPHCLDEEFRPLFKGIPRESLRLVEDMIRANVNCPSVDSLGRLFDAAAFVAGIMGGLEGPGETARASYDGQFPMLLEAACGGNIDLSYETLKQIDKDLNVIFRANSDYILVDGNAVIRAIARKRLDGETTESIARYFHYLIVKVLERMACIAREKTGLEIVGLSGGCFMNRLLHEELKARLEKKKFRVMTHRLMPTNDGCISLGQAIIAGYRGDDGVHRGHP